MTSLNTKQIVELVGNYGTELPQVGTAVPYFVAAFSNVVLSLHAIHGHEGTNNCPFTCEITTEPHNHALENCNADRARGEICTRMVPHEHVYGSCAQDCAHNGDDSPPNDGQYDFTLSLETSTDKVSWKAAATCKVIPNDYGPYIISLQLNDAKWVRIMAESHNPKSNADIVLIGHMEFN